ncbi:MAG TPA: beta-propeller fold lactonase family protein, partial [Acidobacteriaceae bacterium]|nr:beta-propeller fold lactonase family protein [Acidobacteriaceae bacterium]
SQYGRITLALVASLALGLSITACNPSFTLGFVYVLSAKSSPGQINAYTIDSVSGALTPPDTGATISSGGQLPIADAIDNRSKWLYVVNEVSNSIVQFGITTGSALQQLNTYSTPGTYPIAVTIDPQSKYLFVVDSFGPAFNTQIAAAVAAGTLTAPKIAPLAPPAAPFATYGCVAVYPISFKDGSLGAAIADPVSGQNCFPLNGAAAAQGSQPIGVSATAFVNYLYVADQGTHTVYGYAVNYTNGVLTALANNNYQAGVKPSAIASDPTGRFVYVTDEYSNQLLGYNVQNDGSLQVMLNGPFDTDLYPSGIVIDPRGLFLYVTNYNTDNVQAYTIDLGTGNPSVIPSNLHSTTGTGPTCISIESAYGRFMYISDNLDNTVSGFELDPHTGILTSVLNAPFAAGGSPTCEATAANGSHPVQSITP